MADKALDLFEQISESPDSFQYAIAFNACAMLADDRAVRLGNKLFRQLPASYKHNAAVTGVLLKMLMEFGQMEDAEEVFRSIGKKNVAIYATMMRGYNHNNQPRKSVALFDQTSEEGLSLNEAAFQVAINAAARVGMRGTCTKIVQRIPAEYRDDLSLNNSIINMWVGYIVSADFCCEYVDGMNSVGQVCSDWSS